MISSKLQQQKNIVMSFKPYTEKLRRKKIGICSILGRIRIWIRIKMIRIRNPSIGNTFFTVQAFEQRRQASAGKDKAGRTIYLSIYLSI